MAFFSDVTKGQAFNPSALLSNNVRHMVNSLNGFQNGGHAAANSGVVRIQVYNASSGEIPAGCAVNFKSDAGRRGPILLVESGQTVTLTPQGIEYLYRVSYNPFNPNQLLISGQLSKGDVFSWAYQPGLKILKSVVADSVPAYKCAFYKNDCYYAKRESGFEDRHIVKAETLELTELPAEEHIVETAESTPSGSEDPEFE